MTLKRFIANVIWFVGWALILLAFLIIGALLVITLLPFSLVILFILGCVAMVWAHQVRNGHIK